MTEPKTGVTFEARLGDMSLLGVGLRTKSILKFRVYAIGLYVADSALSGPLAAHRGRVGTSAFFGDLITGDFEKQFVLRLVRDLTAEQIQGAFRSHMPLADETLLDQFASYFTGTEAGEACVLHWAPGGTLETTVGGVIKPAIADREFAEGVFAIWLGQGAVQDQVRKRLVSRVPGLLQRPGGGE